MSDYRCPLGTIQPVPMDIERIKADAWENDGILVIRVNDPRLNWAEQEQVKQLGDKLYGTTRTRRS